MENRINTHGGDDLDDDFIPDELVALSDDEGALQAPDADINALLSADEDAEEIETETQRNQAAAEKKRKRREKDKERKAKACVLHLT